MYAGERRRACKIAQQLASGGLEGECRHEALQVPYRGSSVSTGRGPQAGEQTSAWTEKKRKRVSIVPGLLSTSPAVRWQSSEAAHLDKIRLLSHLPAAICVHSPPSIASGFAGFEEWSR